MSRVVRYNRFTLGRTTCPLKSDLQRSAIRPKLPPARILISSTPSPFILHVIQRVDSPLSQRSVLRISVISVNDSVTDFRREFIPWRQRYVPLLFQDRTYLPVADLHRVHNWSL
ncbi:hypothetical protein L2E82_32345 [Cichorium intybus]|uniref:Uncharacterized protein n=1 Tax=Cichorium intybus TaxID=13427 RepID=A0ACB9BHR8_CICIN|nr:hypothetical protein L2E82_32345 [Cichorium intybus]